MAYQTYRYRWDGPTKHYLDMEVDPAFPVTVLDQGPHVQVDVSADDSTKDDLDAAMAQQGWSFVETNPASPAPQTTRQVVSTFLNADASTVSAVFAPLLSLNLTTSAGMLEILAAAATEALVAPGYMRLVVDGVAVAQSGAGHDVGLMGHSLLRRVPIAAGPHTVELQWRTDVGGTLECRPMANPDQEHASLLVRETF